jgi:hypothetical protein
MKQRFFDKATALNMLGRGIQSLVGFSGVPGGTTGRVIRADPVSHPFAGGGAPAELYDLAIQWDLPNRGKPLVDWFTKDEYEKFLIELETNTIPITANQKQERR